MVGSTIKQVSCLRYKSWHAKNPGETGRVPTAFLAMHHQVVSGGGSASGGYSTGLKCRYHLSVWVEAEQPNIFWVKVSILGAFWDALEYFGALVKVHRFGSTMYIILGTPTSARIETQNDVIILGGKQCPKCRIIIWSGHQMIQNWRAWDDCPNGWPICDGLRPPTQSWTCALCQKGLNQNKTSL